MIRKCYNCGEEISDYEDVCPNCGADQKSPKVVRRAGRVILRFISPLFRRGRSAGKKGR